MPLPRGPTALGGVPGARARDSLGRPRTATASKLRANVYRVLDQVLETGVPVEIERHGRRLRIVADRSVRGPAPSKLTRLKARPYLTAAPDTLVHVDWSRQWRP